MFERRHERLISRRKFARRLLRYAAASLGIVVFSLGLGMVGYHVFEGMTWLDSFVNAAMLMGGMGPVGELHSAAGKLFAGFYALYCGLVLLIAAGIFLAPIVHRFLHHFHIDPGR
jgi:hypothetical protein